MGKTPQGANIPPSAAGRIWRLCIVVGVCYISTRNIRPHKKTMLLLYYIVVVVVYIILHTLCHALTTTAVRPAATL